MTDRLEEVYEKYVKPLPTVERLRLLEMTAHDLALTAPLAPKKTAYSGTAWIRQRNLARDRCPNICRWSS